MMRLAEGLEEPRQGRVLVVLLPARRKGDMAWARCIAYFAKAHAGIGKTGP